MIKNVLQITCDRCKNQVIKDDPEQEIDAIPDWLILRQAYSNALELHLCVSCKSDFKMFMENKSAVSPRVFAMEFGDTLKPYLEGK